MRLRKFRILSVLVLPAVTLLGHAAFADKCDDLRDPEPRIVACTQSINSGKWKGRDQAVNYNNRGISYLAKGDADRAIADHTKAIGLDSKYAKAYYNRGISYKAKGDSDRAIADYDKAIGLDPKNASAYYNRGNLYKAKGDTDRAIADFGKAISLDPKDDTAYNNRGALYQAKGDAGRAIADYDKAISLDPKYAQAYYNRGTSYVIGGDADRAIPDFNESIRLDPKSAIVYFNRGVAYQAKGDADRAIADYDKAISLDPKDGSAYNNRGNSYEVKGDPDRAMADYNEAIRIAPEDDKAYFSRGRLFFYGKSFAKAQADFRHITERSPKDAYVALWLDLAERREKNPGHLALAAKQLDMKAWPSPIVRLFLNQSDFAQALAAADDNNARTRQGQSARSISTVGNWHCCRTSLRRPFGCFCSRSLIVRKTSSNGRVRRQNSRCLRQGRERLAKVLRHGVTRSQGPRAESVPGQFATARLRMTIIQPNEPSSASQP